jgi:hypothetical protein
MTPKQRDQYDKARKEQIQVRDWLLGLMSQSPQKPATKDVLREIAIRKFRCSRTSFNGGWDWAIIESGNDHWWEPLPRRKKQKATN